MRKIKLLVIITILMLGFTMTSCDSDAQDIQTSEVKADDSGIEIPPEEYDPPPNG